MQWWMKAYGALGRTRAVSDSELVIELHDKRSHIPGMGACNGQQTYLRPEVGDTFAHESISSHGHLNTRHIEEWSCIAITAPPCRKTIISLGQGWNPHEIGGTPT